MSLYDIVLSDGSHEWVDGEELEAAAYMFDRLLDGTLYTGERAMELGFEELMRMLREVYTDLSQKGYKSLYTYLSVDPVDMDFSVRIDYSDEYGTSNNVRAFVWKDGEPDNGKQTYGISVSLARDAVSNMIAEAKAVQPWDDVKTERALAQLAKAVDNVEELGEKLLTEAQLALIAQIKQEMHELAGNALPAPTPALDVPQPPEMPF